MSATLATLAFLVLAAQAISAETDPKDICKEPKLVGSCRGSFPRWWYNAATKHCELFTYGGCEGNDNNFVSEEACGKVRDVCKATGPGKNREAPNNGMCDLPKIVGPCKSSLPRWWYNSKTQNCERFLYGGCEGNENNFRSVAECGKLRDTCKAAGLCNLPNQVGPCKGDFVRWWFNAATKKCETFSYGGCLGNENNFQIETECEKVRDACLKTDLIIPDKGICKQPKVVGSCRGSFLRWWYNAETKNCEQFIFGGCEGNENNFEIESECIRLKKDCGLA
jgi:hypothetical protein